MTFGEHLEELRKRIVRAMLGSIGGVAICLIFYRQILWIVTRPLKLACEAHNLPFFLNTLKPQEAFLTSITLAFQAGLVLTSPWIIYQLWQFVAAGLYPRERRIVYRYTAPSALLFLLGVAFFYFIVLPLTLNFFISFTMNTAGGPATPSFWERWVIGAPAEPKAATQPVNATAPATAAGAEAAILPATMPMPVNLPVFLTDPPAPPPGEAFLYFDARDNIVKCRTHDAIIIFMVGQQGSLFTTTWRYDDYLSFVMFTALIFGLAFELPMVMLILAQIGIVETKTYRGIRKYAYFVILIAAVIVAPSGDPTTLLFLFVPLLGLYELGILCAAIVTRGSGEEATS